MTERCDFSTQVQHNSTGTEVKVEHNRGLKVGADSWSGSRWGVLEKEVWRILTQHSFDFARGH